MELERLLNIQKNLDCVIVDNLMKKIESYGKVAGVDIKSLSRETLESSDFILSFKILGLSVEVGELANTTNCFKYWSNKEPESRNRMLEELVDIYHLLFSVTNSLKFDSVDVEKAYFAKYLVNIDRQNNGY